MQIIKKMPKKFAGENSKAVVARARKAEKVKDEKAAKDKAVEDEYWKDDHKQNAKKQQRKEEAERKRLEQVQRKAENRSLADEESARLEPKVQPSKVTVFQLQKNREQQEREAEEEAKKGQSETHLDAPLVENLNRDEGEIVSGSGMDAALTALTISDSPSSVDKHPEKRMAGAFKAFEEARMPHVKKENPGMRLSQLKQMIRKEWQKSPDNPINIRKLQEIQQMHV